MKHTGGVHHRRRAVHALVAVAAALSLTACRGDSDRAAAELAHGSPEQGRQVIARYGCGSCHAIPGIPGATATAGPPLAGIAGRSYIAGVLVNQPDNMVRWLLDPPAVDSNTAMPKLGLDSRDARNAAAYLYTLR
jgi:cytochrome c2